MAFRAHPTIVLWIGLPSMVENRAWAEGTLLEVTGVNSKKSLENSPVCQQVHVLYPFMERSKVSKRVSGFEGNTGRLLLARPAKAGCEDGSFHSVVDRWFGYQCQSQNEAQQHWEKWKMQKPLYSELLKYIPSTRTQPWSELYLSKWLSYMHRVTTRLATCQTAMVTKPNFPPRRAGTEVWHSPGLTVYLTSWLEKMGISWCKSPPSEGEDTGNKPAPNPCLWTRCSWRLPGACPTRSC